MKLNSSLVLNIILVLQERFSPRLIKVHVVTEKLVSTFHFWQPAVFVSFDFSLLVAFLFGNSVVFISLRVAG